MGINGVTRVNKVLLYFVGGFILCGSMRHASACDWEYDRHVREPPSVQRPLTCVRRPSRTLIHCEGA